MEQKNFPYDAIYKAIFSEKPLVKSLLLDFVRLPFVADFDFSRLEPFPANYATPAFSRHENDLVWRVEMNGAACIIYIMLEFQSRQEKWMAARIANYTTLLLDSLIAQQPDDLNLRNGLPPILPIVIYNGETKWRAANTLSGLFMPMPAQLRGYQPGQKYFPLDIRHMSAKTVREAHGEASFFVRLERSESASETLGILKDVMEKCSGPEYDRFRRLLRNFVLCCMERASWTDDLDKPMPMEEFEVLYDNYPKWVTAPWEEGLQRGRTEGLKEGRKEGRTEGLKEGRKEERAAILCEQMSSLKEAVTERFGSLPKSWASALGKLKDPKQIIELACAVYTTKTPKEFEARLLNMEDV